MVKEGNILVHHGDTITYTFDVSNTGNTPLENVSVEDPTLRLARSATPRTTRTQTGTRCSRTRA